MESPSTEEGVPEEHTPFVGLEWHQGSGRLRFLCVKEEHVDLEQRAGTVAQQEKT